MTQQQPPQKLNNKTEEIGQIKSMPTSTMDIAGPNQRKIVVAPSYTLKLFILPIFVIVVFFLFLVVGILPNLNSIFSTLDDISQASSDYEKNLGTLKTLQTIAAGTTDLDNNLSKINTLASSEEQTTVALFQQKIADIARQQGLTIIGQETGEKILNKEGQAQLNTTGSTPAPPTSDQETNANPNAIGIIEIPSIFHLEGKLDNIKSFIAKLNDIDDFVIVGEMSLQAKQRTDEKLFITSDVDWSLELDLLKYQFQVPTEKNNIRQKYLSVPLSAVPEKSVLDYINRTKSSDGLTVNVVGGN